MIRDIARRQKAPRFQRWRKGAVYFVLELRIRRIPGNLDNRNLTSIIGVKQSKDTLINEGHRDLIGFHRALRKGAKDWSKSFLNSEELCVRDIDEKELFRVMSALDLKTQAGDMHMARKIANSNPPVTVGARIPVQRLKV
jgi:hypothetical protein